MTALVCLFVFTHSRLGSEGDVCWDIKSVKTNKQTNA